MTTYIFKEWVADAGINKPVSFHTLRHTYATLLHENGNSLCSLPYMPGIVSRRDASSSLGLHYRIGKDKV